MKIKFLYLHLLFLFFSVSIYGHMNNENGKTFRIALKNYPPFTGKKLENLGPLTIKIKEALNRRGYQVNFSILSEERAVSELSVMNVDGIFPFHQNIVLAQKFQFSNTLFISPYYLYYFGPDHPNSFTSFDDLFNGKTIASHNSVDLGPFFSNLSKKNANFILKSSSSANLPCAHLKKLKEKKYHFVALGQLEAKYWIYKCFINDAKNIFHIQKPIGPGNFSMFFNKNNPNTQILLEIINEEFIHPLEVF